MFDVSDSSNDESIIQQTSKGVRVSGSNTSSKILSQLPDSGRGWYILKPNDYPTELRTNSYLKIFNKKGRSETRGSRSDRDYIYVFEKLRPVGSGTGGGGGGNSDSNSNSTLLPASGKVEQDTTPTVFIISPKTGENIDLTDKKHIKKNIVDHTVLEGETAESIVKQITGKTDLSAITEMKPKAYHPGDKVLSGYQLKVENGLALKISGSVMNSTVVELNVTGSVSGTKTLNVEKAEPNVVVGWDTKIPMQGGHGPLKIEAKAGGIPAISEPEIAKPNWVDIEYKVEGQSFDTEGIVILRFDNGTTLRGTLDNGLSHFPLVPFMPFSVEFQPSKEKKKELDKLYDELDKILTQEVEKAKQEAALIKEAYKKLPWFIKNKVNEFYTLKGVGHWIVDTAKGIWSLVFGAAKVVVQTQVWMAKFHLHHLKMGTCSISGDQDCVKLESDQIQAMLKEVGDDASKVTETAETLYYLAHDGKTGKRLVQFGKDYFSALSVPQQHQFVSRHGVDILLLFVGGSGAVLLGIKNAGKITAIIKKIAAILKTFPTKLKFKKTKNNVNNRNTFPPKLKYPGSLPGKAKPGLPRKDIDKTDWPLLPGKEAANFTNVEAKLLPRGTIIYRVIEKDSSAAGSYWAYKLPKSKTEWRSKYAVLDDWNDNGKYVEYIVKEKDGLKVWSGETAGQNIGKNGPHYPGGDEQIWIPRNYVTPSPSKPTNW